MEKDRLAAFSDGVIAVIITIMVLDLRIPHAANLAALRALAPIFVSYVLSFIYVAIYWNNHHHFFHLVARVNGAVLWANMNLLFWLSLIPFTTSWLGANDHAPWPAALYGISLLMTALAWFIMERIIIRSQGPESAIEQALGRDFKARISPLLYLTGIMLAFIEVRLAEAIYALVALLWIIPDRRVEAKLVEAELDDAK
ncbi:TMEM175 family protein [Acidocella sp.]|uniref:TMEM175 family protein n=1 Tax=Acidocella sp. TaxID=50710 RepID=UPI00261FCDB1|nr:TMEM175 family protein [Acidocella sp.]